MARAFWKGSISFGMVIIPVQLVVATRERPISFHLLHTKCHTRPKQVWFCEKDEVYFGNDETVRGYEYARGHYITLDELDFDRVPLQTRQLIEITGFVSSADVDPILFNKGYYMEPQPQGFKAYSLLQQVMEKTGRVAVAKLAMQRREHLCVLMPVAGMIELHTLFYADEVGPSGDLNIPRMELTKTEMAAAIRLVESMESQFDLGDYHDEYHAALMKVIKAKLKGVEIPKPKAPRTQPEGDLLSALKASVPRSRQREKATA